MFCQLTGLVVKLNHLSQDPSWDKTERYASNAFRDYETIAIKLISNDSCGIYLTLNRHNDISLTTYISVHQFILEHSNSHGFFIIKTF